MYTSILVELSDTFMNEIRQEFVEEADWLCCHMSFCNSWVAASKEGEDVSKSSVAVVGLGDGVDEVEMVAVVKCCEGWGSSCCWWRDVGDVGFVDDEGEC